mmetsp:Transcript_45563/g.103240  ORF Transcript_45563/g.103240 Transcript_45563/m.103240 type:complete len:348 (-) Transcript_45563:372-1415(-)
MRNTRAARPIGSLNPTQHYVGNPKQNDDGVNHGSGGGKHIRGPLEVNTNTEFENEKQDKKSLHRRIIHIPIFNRDTEQNGIGTDHYTAEASNTGYKVRAAWGISSKFSTASSCGSTVRKACQNDRSSPLNDLSSRAERPRLVFIKCVVLKTSRETSRIFTYDPDLRCMAERLGFASRGASAEEVEDSALSELEAPPSATRSINVLSCCICRFENPTSTPRAAAASCSTCRLLNSPSESSESAPPPQPSHCDPPWPNQGCDPSGAIMLPSHDLAADPALSSWIFEGRRRGSTPLGCGTAGSTWAVSSAPANRRSAVGGRTAPPSTISSAAADGLPPASVPVLDCTSVS